MNYLASIYHFFNHPFFVIIGGITVLFAVAGFFYKTSCWFFNIAPIVVRLGHALWKRNIAIFSSNDGYISLTSTLLDSKIFKKKNITLITKDNIEKAKDETIYLVDWETWGDKINQIFLTRKNHQTAIIIYAKPASIPHEIMNEIGNKPNTVVVNFRGRLLNDILTTLLTTSYDR